ncbi:MAG: hypothetical protein ABR502_11765, partial [Chitinophagaceae bacterium]
KIQFTYHIKIVSAARGAIYDCTDHNSFFQMGLEFLLGNSENIKRQNDINGGIYAAKAKEGRFVGSHAPFGYRAEGLRKSRTIVVDPETAPVVKKIFEAFLQSTPFMDLKILARRLGYKTKGSSNVRNSILMN